MKKYFSLIVIITISVNIAISQTDTKQYKNTIQYLHAIEVKAGYTLIENGYDLYDIFRHRKYSIVVPFKQCWGVGVHELHGIYFNPHFSLSVVIGMDFLKLYADREQASLFPEPYPKKYVLDFLLGLDFKYTLLKKYNWSPFLELEVCPVSAELYGLKHPDHAYQNWQRGGLCSLSMGALYRFNDRQSIYAALGYEAVWSQLFLKVGVRLR